MNSEPIDLSLEGAALANLFIVKRVVGALVEKGLITQPEMQACFEAAKEDLHRSTLSISAKQADQLLRLVWAAFVPTGGPDPH